MWNQVERMSNTSFGQHKCVIKRFQGKYRIGRFQCSMCLRCFPEKYRLSAHQYTTRHTGINELNDDTQLLGVKIPSDRCPIICRLSPAFSGLILSVSTDLYEITCDQLEKFIAENIQADSTFLTCCGEVINQLVCSLQGIHAPVKLQPRRIIKSGSLGKGTAVNGRADVDLVLMLAEYNDVLNLVEDLDDLLTQLEKYLVSKTTAKLQRTTKYSVQVEVTCTSGHKHDVDILPAVDLFGLGYSLEDVYRRMGRVSADIIHEYSVTLAPQQLEIIRALPTKVKSLIKLLKYWKDKKLKEKDEPAEPSFAKKRSTKPHWPNSYALELVIINAWSKAKMPTNFDMVRALHAVLTSLVNHRNFRVVLHKQMIYSEAWLKSRPTPFIMDPANPFNDMYHGLVDGKAFDWESVVPEARRWLGKPLFYGVRDTETNW